MKKDKLLRRIRFSICIVIAGLAISGITAFPLETELRWLVSYNNNYPGMMSRWLGTIYAAIVKTNETYPWLSYGTDWLAFAHLMLALLFIGPIKDPVKNVWVIQFGMIACISVIPLAFIAGDIRQIPVFWRIIDCSFGLTGIIPLIVCYRSIHQLKSITV